MPDFSVRSTLPEKMDDPNAPEHELRQNLRELEVVNHLLGGYKVVLHALEQMHWPEHEVTILDIGSGGGDTLRAVANWAKRTNKKVRLIGVDLNPVMTQYAREASVNYPLIEYKTLNVFDEVLLQEQADIVMCSLFCHHFEDTLLIDLLRRMQALGKRYVLINDLHRHWFAYYAISILTALFSKTYMVKHDARLSVARAFTRRDWQQVLAKTGIQHYSLKWRWAWRWELILKK